MGNKILQGVTDIIPGLARFACGFVVERAERRRL